MTEHAKPHKAKSPQEMQCQAQEGGHGGRIPWHEWYEGGGRERAGGWAGNGGRVNSLGSENGDSGREKGQVGVVRTRMGGTIGCLSSLFSLWTDSPCCLPFMWLLTGREDDILRLPISQPFLYLWIDSPCCLLFMEWKEGAVRTSFPGLRCTPLSKQSIRATLVQPRCGFDV